MSNEPLLKASNLGHSRHFCSIGYGQRITVLGHGGAGKTTLARMLLGLPPRFSGSLLLEGQDYLTHPEFRRKVQGLLYPSLPYRELHRHLSLGNELVHALEIVGLSIEEALSAGQAKLPWSAGRLIRLQLARHIANPPAILIADDPTREIDSTSAAYLLQGMAELHRQGCSLVHLTRSPALAEREGESTWVLYQGQIVEQGATTSIFSSPENLVTQRLLAKIPILVPSRRSNADD